MSKMDGLRAMREARYAENAARAKTPTTTKPVAAKAAAKKAAPATPAGAEAEADALCGHRNMSGRTCTRELGHAAKSHRYS
jgi:hypothetical protein